jgi:hypothetical protein
MSVKAGQPQGVTRDHLPVAVHPEPGCPPSRAPALSADRAGDALPTWQAAAARTRAAARYPAHQPATRRGGRPGGAWPLGRRPGLRSPAQRSGDPGRAPQPLCAAVPAPRGSDRTPGPPGADRGGAAAAPAATPLVDLGPGSGDGRTPAVHHRLWCPGLFLRPAQPLAARHQREHQRPAPPYLPRSGDLRQLDQTALDAIAAELNGRPRQTLGFKTPSQALAETLR